MAEHCKRNVVRVPSYEDVSQEIFSSNIYPQRKPAVLYGVDLGCCVQKWSLEYLAKIGGSQPVKIHVAPKPQMNFITKNFAYKTIAFDELLGRISKNKQDQFFLSEDECYYLRSLGVDARKDIADISKDFPGLANDIKWPNFFNQDAFFSSVFRISSKGVQLWTHYDVMDNLLIVISGEKKVVLFPPSDALFLYLRGDKSEIVDIDSPDLGKYPEFSQVTAYECILGPGEVLFIPAMWFHNVINLQAGVAVNVFWRHLKDNFYDSKDVYGNTDLVPANRAMQGLEKALKTLEDLPEEYRDFYGRRMISRIKQKTLTSENH